MLVRTPGARGSRPSGPVLLNRDSPLALGLRATILPESIRPRDLVTGTPLGTPNAGDVTLVPDAAGLSIEANTNNAGIYVPTLPASWQIQPPCTIMAGLRRLGSMGTNIQIVGGLYNLPQTSPYVTWGFYESNNRTDGIGMYANSGGTLIHPGSGMPDADLPLGEYHIWVGVFDVNAQRLYRDGVLVSSGSVSHTSTTYTATSTWGFGDGFNGNPAIRVTHAAQWARALSPQEIWALYDPATRWDLYWQPSTRAYSWYLPAAGGSFNPAWAAGSNQIVGWSPC